MKTQGRPTTKALKFLSKTFKKTHLENQRKSIRKGHQMEPNRESKIHVFDGVGECFVGSRYFTAFVENAFSLPWAMKTSTLGLSISTSISMEFLQGPPGVPRTPQDYIWRSPSIPRDVLGVPTDALRLLSDALEMHLGPPWAPQGPPRHTPGRLVHAQTSTEPPNGHPMTLFPCSKVY